jgi:hypothetical protein
MRIPLISRFIRPRASPQNTLWGSAYTFFFGGTSSGKPFQKKEGSRASLFSEEKAFLLPLPKSAFELATWKIATVQYNYHISVDGQFYSVPYEYIKQKVDVRLTRNVIEVFFEGTRICSHVRLYGRTGQYSTLETHMPPNHQQYTQWNGERFRKWATKIGYAVIRQAS